LPPTASLLAALSLIVVSVVLAAVTYRVVEVRGRHWLRRRLVVGRPTPAAELAVPGRRAHVAPAMARRPRSGAP
jgi:peptidoglycan/LPS O-acetylase OafA/YrhL